MLKFRRALNRLAAADPAVHRQILEVQHLIKPRRVLRALCGTILSIVTRGLRPIVFGRRFVVLREIERRLGLADRLTGCLNDPRMPEKVLCYARQPSCVMRVSCRPIKG